MDVSRRILRTILLTCFLALVGCSVNVANGPLFAPVPLENRSQGVIYVYLLQGVLGWDQGWPVNVDDKFVTKIHNHGYVPIVVEGGTVMISFTDHPVTPLSYIHGAALDVEVPPGESVFVRLTKIEIPNPLHRMSDYRLCLVDRDIGLQEIRHLHLSNSVGSTWHEETFPEFFKRYADCYKPYP